jgi:hypothetical protein
MTISSPPPQPGQDPNDPTLDEITDYLAQEFEHWQALFRVQPPMVQRFVEAQGRRLADAVIQNTAQVDFELPDRLALSEAAPGSTTAVPASLRSQAVKGWIDRLLKVKLVDCLQQRLDELEATPNAAVSTAAGMVRFATATQMVHSMLPSGRTVKYKAASDEEIPSIPVASDMEAASAITATSDAIVEGESAPPEEGRGELLVPFVPAARRFYLPQWVAFDQDDHLLVGSTSEAEAHIASMQRFLHVLHAAVSLAPYMTADPQYQQKRYGMLGQLINQGRALARYETRQIIDTIRQRAQINDLNRGLSLSLPYFDDQELEIKLHNFDVIPGGRVMFVPAFVVLAARKQQVKVAQDTRLDPSTRHHLLNELHMLEQAFDAPSV